MNWNIYFEPRQYMSEVEYAVFMWEGRIFKTEGYLTKEQAKAELPVLEEHELRDGLYYGCLVTQNSVDMEEAQKLAEERGFNEKVLGVAVTVFTNCHRNPKAELN